MIATDLRWIAENARRMVGTPFRHQGRQPRAGLDCVGLVVCSIGGRAFDLDERQYAEWPDGARLQRILTEHFLPIECDYIEDLPAGAVISFAHQRDVCRAPRHLAIRTDAGMVHARRGDRRGVIETEFTDHWRRVFLRGWAWQDQY